jgi:hypothetical protein
MAYRLDKDSASSAPLREDTIEICIVNILVLYVN